MMPGAAPVHVIETVIAENGDAGALGLSAYRTSAPNGDSYTILAILVGSVAALLVMLWHVVRFTGVRHAVLAVSFDCPELGRPVIAEFELDSQGTVIEVRWCTAHRPAAAVRCARRCVARPGGIFGRRSSQRSGLRADAASDTLPAYRRVA